MKLSFFKRKVGKKGETNRIRREGNIPANLYAQNVTPEAVYLKGEEVKTLLRNMRPGLLSTTVFELQGENIPTMNH